MLWIFISSRFEILKHEVHEKTPEFCFHLTHKYKIENLFPIFIFENIFAQIVFQDDL